MTEKISDKQVDTTVKLIKTLFTIPDESMRDQAETLLMGYIEGFKAGAGIVKSQKSA